MRRRRELADETFEIEVHDVLANDENGVVIATGRATRGGTLEWRAHGHTSPRPAASPSAGYSRRTCTNSTGFGASGTAPQRERAHE